MIDKYDSTVRQIIDIIISPIFYVILFVFRIFTYGLTKWPSRKTGLADVALVSPITTKIYRLPAKAPLSMRHQKHEDRHREQIAFDGTFAWLINEVRFLVKYGYRDNPYEVDARNCEHGIIKPYTGIKNI